MVAGLTLHWYSMVASEILAECQVKSFARSGPTIAVMALYMAAAMCAALRGLFPLSVNTDDLGCCLCCNPCLTPSRAKFLAAFLGVLWYGRYRGCAPHT